MTMKVQGSSVPAVQSQQTQQAASRPQPPAQNGGVVPGGKDDFIQRPIDIGGLLGKERPTLNWGDRMNAAGLHSSLSSPVNDLRLALGEKTETITRNPDGSYRGPEGQPLVQVKLDDGNTAYVDPNTNKYYLTNEGPNFLGQVATLPAADLPKGSQFSNSHFSGADAKELTQIAKSHNPFGSIKIPRDFPPYGPLSVDDKITTKG
ncbi:MAG TPA: hypothetical protein VFB81_13430 [Myxococcales bacterium]|nr:hypothetical protein [Myxococcales bacterium]